MTPISKMPLVASPAKTPGRRSERSEKKNYPSFSRS
jgi:hypothetical protein